MVKGIQRFVEHFKGLEHSYILIGGAACDLWLSDPSSICLRPEESGERLQRSC